LRNKNNQGVLFVGIKIKPYKENIEKKASDTIIKNAINNINELKIGTPVKMSTPDPYSYVDNIVPNISTKNLVPESVYKL